MAGKFFADRKNRRAQQKQNEQDMQFQRDMYAWTRKDALDDWNRTNAYNHPLQQMQRLDEAGINPNALAGQGFDATAGAIRSGDASGSNHPAALTDADMIPNAIQDSMRLAGAQASIDATRQGIELSQTEELLKKAQIAESGQRTATSAFQLQQSQELKDSVIEHARLSNEKLRADTEFTDIQADIALERNEREALVSSTNVELTVQHILESKLRQAKVPLEREQLEVMIANAKKEGVLKQLDIDLRKQGVMPSDPIYWRFLTRALMDSTTHGGVILNNHFPFLNK